MAAVGVTDTGELASYQLGGLVPGDADILRLTTVLGVALPLGVKVHTAHGVGDAVFAVGAGTFRVHHGGDVDGLLRGEGLATGLDGPWNTVLLVQLKGADTLNLAVLYIDRDRATTCTVCKYLFHRISILSS